MSYISLNSDYKYSLNYEFNIVPVHIIMGNTHSQLGHTLNTHWYDDPTVCSDNVEAVVEVLDARLNGSWYNKIKYSLPLRGFLPEICVSWRLGIIYILHVGTYHVHVFSCISFLTQIFELFILSLSFVSFDFNFYCDWISKCSHIFDISNIRLAYT